MKTQLRHLVADALHQTKAYSLPAVCERYGLEPGDSDEAFSSKTRYVMRRLERLSDERVLAIARQVATDFPDDKLQAAIEQLDKEGRLLSDVTRLHLAEALNLFVLEGKRDLIEMLRKHWPVIDAEPSWLDGETLADDIRRHAVLNHDWENADILERVGFLNCSQAKLFKFLEDVVHPIGNGMPERSWERLLPPARLARLGGE